VWQLRIEKSILHSLCHGTYNIAKTVFVRYTEVRGMCLYVGILKMEMPRHVQRDIII